MSAKRKFPQKGDTVVVNHENSSETYFFDGENLVDSVGTMFSGKDIDWNEMWKTDKTWRFASYEERKAYEEELNKNGLFISNYDTIVPNVVKRVKLKTETPLVFNYHYIDKFTKADYVCTTSFDVYKNEIVRLYELLDEVEFLAKIGYVESESKGKVEELFERIETLAKRRKINIKPIGNDLFFNNEQLTNYQGKGNDGQGIKK